MDSNHCSDSVSGSCRFTKDGTPTLTTGPHFGDSQESGFVLDSFHAATRSLSPPCIGSRSRSGAVGCRPCHRETFKQATLHLHGAGSHRPRRSIKRAGRPPRPGRRGACPHPRMARGHDRPQRRPASPAPRDHRQAAIRAGGQRGLALRSRRGRKVRGNAGQRTDPR